MSIPRKTFRPAARVSYLALHARQFVIEWTRNEERLIIICENEKRENEEKS